MSFPQWVHSHDLRLTKFLRVPLENLRISESKLLWTGLRYLNSLWLPAFRSTLGDIDLDKNLPMSSLLRFSFVYFRKEGSLWRLLDIGASEKSVG